MVEPTFNTEDIDEFLDRIRIVKLKAEMRDQQQQIDRPSVVTIRRLEAENARLKDALKECDKTLMEHACSICDWRADRCWWYDNDPPCRTISTIKLIREVLGDA